MAWDFHTMASPSCITGTRRIHREEIRQVESAELAAGVDMLVRQFKLANQPHDFLDIERTAPPPDFQHVVLTRHSMDRSILAFSLRIVGDRTDAAENFGLKFALLGTGEFDA
jgi:hypothetical protein